jgi:[ribosomal protein S18]-alanine N-acetyltransferase
MKGRAIEFEIRPMTAADIDRVMEIAASLPDAPHWPRAVYANALAQDATPQRICIVAVQMQSGAIGGFAVASLLPAQAELESIAVAGGYQRQGVGRSLFDDLVRKLRSGGIKEITLEVRASNLSALAFYRSLGFVQTAVRRRYYVDPVEDAVLMTSQIT